MFLRKSLHSLVCLAATLAGHLCSSQIWAADGGRHAATLWAIVRTSDAPDTLDRVLSQPEIDGVVFYVGVAKIAPSENKLDWSPIDRAIALSQRAGKPLKLALLAGRWVPAWFYEKGAQKFSWTLHTAYVDAGSSRASAPLPWDPVYLREMERVVKTCAERYRDVATIREIQITGPALTNGLEMNLVISAEQAVAIGYTPEKLAAAWNRMVDCYATAFPKKQLSLALNNLVAGERTTVIADTVKAQAFDRYGTRISVLVCYATYEPWFSRGNSAVDIWTHVPKQVKQEAQLIDIFSVKGVSLADTSAAVIRARELGAESIEIFAADLLQAPYRKAIDAARRQK